MLFSLPPDKRGLPENVSPLFKFPDGILHGKNDFGRIGFGGPCPPANYPHNYRFTLYALSKRLEISSGASKQ
ncbi:YbhB/YbcL family Raf kinase inhibitor-like protein [Chloroflexota bacterium]